MKKEQHFTFSYTYYLSEQDLPAEELTLLQAASRARENAYAPYSDFLVGAAVELEDGTIVPGNNQENAASPSSLCAERVAVYHASALHPGKRIVRIAVCGGRRGETNLQPVSPCGACRQVISEVIKRYRSDFDVILIGRKTTISVKASQLLPFAFDM